MKAKTGSHPRGPLNLFPPRANPRPDSDDVAYAYYRINGFAYKIGVSEKPFAPDEVKILLRGMALYVAILDQEPNPPEVPARLLALAGCHNS